MVRSEKNIAALREKSSLIAKSQDEGILDFAIIPDFLKEGEIAKVLGGVTAILHLASPLAAQVRTAGHQTSLKLT